MARMAVVAAGLTLGTAPGILVLLCCLKAEFAVYPSVGNHLEGVRLDPLVVSFCWNVLVNVFVGMAAAIVIQ